MKKSILSFSFAGLMLVFAACGSKTSNDSKETAEEQNDQKFDDSKTEKDADFAVEAADGGMLEVQLGQLAQSNGSSAQVKEFGKMMVDEHSKANDELKALAQQKGITLPATLSEKCQKKFNDLAEKKGADFDKEYIDMMVKDHKDDIDEFKKEADKGEDADLKSWASAKLPTLQHHLEVAQNAQDMVKNEKKSSSNNH
jgi:putative membrane protein